MLAVPAAWLAAARARQVAYVPSWVAAVVTTVDSSWPLVAVAVVADLIPDISRPGKLLCGHQGVGESTWARRLVDLVGPFTEPFPTWPLVDSSQTAGPSPTTLAPG